MVGFLIWALCGLLFAVLGIYDICSKKAKPFGFWANAETFEVTDVRAYNRALGILWILFGILFAALGLPLLDGQNSPYIIISILGVMFEAIGAMVVYVTVIEKKYKKGQ